MLSESTSETNETASPAVATTAEADRVPLGQKLAIGAGGMTQQVGHMAFGLMAQPIFQIVLGLNPLLFGIAMTIPRVMDAFIDPVVGSYSDNFRSKWGRRRPFIFVGALGLALTYALAWWVPRDAGQNLLFAYVVTAGILYYLCFAIYTVPVTSLSYEMTPDYHERTRVMAFWGFFTACANLVVTWLAPLTQWEGFGDALSGARWVSLVISLVFFAACGIIPALFVRERFYQRAAHQEKVSFWAAIRQAGSSRPMLTLVFMVLALFFCGAVTSSIAQYIIIYHVCGGDLKQGLFLNSLNGTGFVIVGLVAIPVVSKVAQKMGKQRGMYLVMWMALFGGISKWFIYTPDFPYMLLLEAVLNGPVWVALGTILPSMLADLCDYDEYHHGQRREGMLSAVYMWITKMGLSLTFLFTGVALTISGFDPKLGINQPEGTMLTMRILFTVASALPPLLAIICLKFYPITEQLAHQMRLELEARRGKV